MNTSDDKKLNTEEEKKKLTEPLSYYVFGPFFQFALILGIRYSYRFCAGEAGRNIIREIHRCDELNEIPVLHVHHEDEDGSMYPLAKGSHKVGEIIGQTALRPQKYWISCEALTPIMLKDINIDIKSVTERHSLSIPALDPIMIGMINVSTKILLSALRLARVMGDVYCKIFYDIFGISIDSKYKQNLGDGYLVPLLI
ncbi:MAG: hypothetical protein K6F55_04080 [Eubacterium sp.]|nr:hypothetical protein [Eubacterium sp.]